MLKTGIENLKDGMKVVVEDMSKVMYGHHVGESGQVLTITQEFNNGGSGWRLLNPDTGVYMYISPDEYKYVKVLNEGEDMKDLANCDKLVEKYPEGTLLKCLVDDLEWYSKGVVYEVGYCKTYPDDYGVQDQDGDVMMEALIVDFYDKEVGSFDPTQWEVVTDNFKELYPEGTRLKCLVDDLEWYSKGEVYKVGYCRTVGSDYGVIDEDGQVMMEATIYDYARNVVGDFDPTQWEVVELEKVKVEEPKQEPKFKVGDLVVRARAIGNMFTSYPVGTVMEVRSDITIVGTYWCEGYTPHSEAEGQYVKEEELELASIEDIKKLTQEFVEKSSEDNSEEAPDITYILADVHNQIEDIRRMCTALDYKVALTLAELDDK